MRCADPPTWATRLPGTPMSTTCTRPARAAPPGVSRPSLKCEKVTVTRASTATPSARPLSASRPEGRSTANRGAAAPFTARTTSARKPSRGRSRPVPKSASTTRSAPPRASFSGSSGEPAGSSETSPPTPRHASRFARASREVLPASPQSHTVGSAPRTRRWRAMTSPSPPLLPVPHTTMTRASPASPSRSSRTRTSVAPRPAFSMRTRLGTWHTSMACRSKARICSRERTGVTAGILPDRAR